MLHTSYDSFSRLRLIVEGFFIFDDYESNLGAHFKKNKTLNRLMRLIFFKQDYELTLAIYVLKNNDYESTLATHVSKTKGYESTHATLFFNDYESTQATLDQNWAHERYRQLRLFQSAWPPSSRIVRSGSGATPGASTNCSLS